MITFPSIGYQGRLGNQMFQYALLVGVAEKRRFEIVIPDDVLLDFQIAATRCRRDSIPSPSNHYYESVPAFCFNPRVFDQPDGTAYTGYYQSYRYFEHAEARLRREFVFSSKTRLAAQCWIDEIIALADGRPTVGVHVRRGDYVGLQHYHRLFDWEYFEAANRILDIGSPFFVFYSDDMDWIRKKMCSVSQLAYYCLDEPDALTCMCVASSACQHFVCSASSFGWWSAWLSAGTDKRVAVPSPWYGPAFEAAEEANEMSPKNWIRVSEQG